MFNLKERKKKKEEELSKMKADAEFNAKYTAKQERKNVEKVIVEIDNSIKVFYDKAIEAKNKGYNDMYKKCISFIKIAKMRKKQADMFLFEMDAMQQMQSISKNSKELFTSMKSVMGTLGKLSIDKAVISNMNTDFRKTQAELDKQSSNIEMALSGMEMQITDNFDDDEISDDEIEMKISGMMNKSDNTKSDFKTSERSADDEMEYLQSLLKN